jgi:hypothetical protein
MGDRKKSLPSMEVSLKWIGEVMISLLTTV